MSLTTLIKQQTIIPLTEKNTSLITNLLKAKVKLARQAHKHNGLNPKSPNLFTLLHGVNHALSNDDGCEKHFLKLSEVLMDEENSFSEGDTTSKICKLEEKVLTAYFKIKESKSVQSEITLPSFKFNPRHKKIIVNEKKEFEEYRLEDFYNVSVWINSTLSLVYVYYFEKRFYNCLSTKRKQSLPKALKTKSLTQDKEVAKYYLGKLKKELEANFTTVSLQKS